ncbi:MAG: hypothetical protein K0Q79_2605 [Flavipsychrobacter sp.]|jgi:opacity protein-like surface antigen|nr:hypothetical protein [Flavipsychrobacter sp.]
MRMKINVVLCSMILLAAHACFAQDTVAKRQRMHDHFIGVQLNELVRQVISEDITGNLKPNPYLLTYAENSRRSDFGIRAGLGGQFHKLKNKSAPAFFPLDTISKLTSVQLRFGVIWSKSVYKNFVAGLGVDLAGNYHNENIKVMETGGSFPIFSESSTLAITYGGGPVVTLRYDFTQRIALGTEASFYYMVGSSKVYNVANNGTPTNKDTENQISSGSLNLPVVLYFTVRI